MKKYKVGIIGSGAIAGNYIRHAKEVYSDYYEITTVTDLDVEKAKHRADVYEIPNYGLPELVYNDPDIDIVINLRRDANRIHFRQYAFVGIYLCIRFIKRKLGFGTCDDSFLDGICFCGKSISGFLYHEIQSGIGDERLVPCDEIRKSIALFFGRNPIYNLHLIDNLFFIYSKTT